MFCRNCANPLDDRAIACTKCGLNPRDGNSCCQNCGKPTFPNAIFCVNCGAALAHGGGQSDSRASNKIVAGICGIVFGSFGVHKFILGYTRAGVIMLLTSIIGGWLTCFMSWYAMALIGFIEGIIYLTKSDEDFVRTYVLNRREWF